MMAGDTTLGTAPILAVLLCSCEISLTVTTALPELKFVKTKSRAIIWTPLTIDDFGNVGGVQR